MFMEAVVKEGAKGGSGKNNVLLAGKGFLITSENQIKRLRAAGMQNVTIDTSKGKDSGSAVAIQAPKPIVMPREPR